MAKKFTATLLLITIIFSALLLPAGADARISYGTKGADAQGILFALDILDEENFSGEKQVTRGDFIYTAVKLYNLGELVSGKTQFPDVNDSDPRKNAISFAADSGIISGMGDGTFHPDDILLKEQAAKIIVSLLGYDVLAISYGGYPAGYLSVATMLGLFKGITVGDFKECTWESAARMLYNALDVDILQSLNDKHETVEGENPLTKWMGINKVSGNLVKNSISLSKNRVQIEDEIYSDLTECADGMLGFPVDAYYKTNAADEKEIIYITRKYQSEYTIAADDINPDTSVSNLVYEGEEKSISLPIDKNVFFVKNYTVQDISAEKMKIPCGYMIASDSDGNGNIDVIAVFESRVYVVDEINRISYVIKDLYDEPDLRLDFEDDNSDISISSYGGAKTFADIRENDVLTVCKSDDGKYTDIIISSVKIKGTVEEKGKSEIKIKGKTYEVLSSAKDVLSSVETGKVTTVYLDKDGFVAGARESSISSKEYGFLIAAMADDSGSLKAKTALLRLFKMDGEIETFETTDEIEVNGSTMAPQGGKYDGEKLVKMFYDGGVLVNQLITYGVDENRKIFKVNTATDNTSNVGEDEESFSLDFDFPAKNKGNMNMTSLVYNDAAGGSLSHQVGLSGTKVISVPKLSQDEQMIDREREIRFVNHTVEYVGKRISELQAYDMDEDLNAAVMLVPSELGGGGDIPDQPFVIVDKVVESLDKDGSPEKVMYAWCEGKYEKYYFGEELSADDKNLQRGDVIRIVNAPSGIKKVSKIFTFKGTRGEQVEASDGTGYFITSGFPMDKSAYDDWFMEKYDSRYNKIYRRNTQPQWEQLNVAIHCKPVKAGSNYVVISMGKEGISNKRVNMNRSNIIKYDEVTDTLTKATYADINPDDESQSLLIRINYSTGGEIYIIDRRSDAAIPWGGDPKYGQY